MEQTNQKKMPGTLSPKWLILLKMACASLFISLLVAALFYYYLSTQFNQDREQELQQDVQLIQNLTRQSEHRLNRLFGITMSLQGISDALSTSNKDSLQRLFEQHWQHMQYDWNLDQVAFYDWKNQLLANWSNYPTDEALSARMQEWAISVNKEQNSIKVVSCVPRCSQYLVSPVEKNGENLGVLIIAVSLLDTMDRFHQLSNKAVGLLVPAKDRTTSTDTLVYKWGLSLYSMTDADQYKPVLQKLSENFEPLYGTSQRHETDYQNQIFDVSLLPISSSEDSFVSIIENLSGTKLVIVQRTLIMFLAVFIVLTLLTSFLYLILRKAINIQTVSNTELEKTSITATVSDLTAQMSPVTNTKTPIDFDLADHDTVSITDRLNKLKQYNSRINIELARQMLNLSNERDQVKKVLDHTQTIIMTLTKSGSIKTINRFGETITGYSKREIKGRNFFDLYPEQEPYALNDLNTLVAVSEGKQETYRHEARLYCKSGKEKVILWLHTALGKNNQILTTGLDITESKQLEKNLSWLADHDSLTSIFNRRRFESELEDALQWANNHQTHGALFFIDLDNFKDINDSCGHQVGDAILRKVANALSSLAVDIDSSAHFICARIGGDEFVIILRNIDTDAASILSVRILEKISQIYHKQDDLQFQLSCCIGVAPFPRMEQNAYELLTNADFAMYQAKLFGKNQFYIFKDDDTKREQNNHRLIWKDRIQNALEKDLFVLHFQPILNIQSRTISHYETLIRMLDENGEIIPPGIFINMAEELGLIQQIDQFVLESSIKKSAELFAEGHDVKLAINLSGKAFDDPNLSIIIQRIIEENDAKPENLIFEITETAAVSDVTAAERIITEIQDLGCQFALDDFGVGFSSFYYLRELPVEYVKIDGSFIDDLANNADNQVLVRALSEVAIGFNKLSVAEFVDSIDTVNILKEAKVNYAQGYFIGRPSEKIPVEPPSFQHNHGNAAVV